jgi:CMP/dCMP kinase
LIIAIDGPAAAGKGTLARRLAAHLDYAYLDSGGLYRAVALAMIRQGLSVDDASAAAGVASSLDHNLLTDPALRDEATGIGASVVAAYPGVREALLGFQRQFAAAPPNGKAGAVIDGRDIGTIVFPDAPVKFFITASDEVRARRRWLELSEKGEAVDVAAVLDEIRQRDKRDRERQTAPLKPAKDALLLDTTLMDANAAFAAALALIK